MSEYKAHLFICTKCQYMELNGEPCSEDTAKKFRKSVKDMAREQFPKSDVRINASGCLDRCQQGISSVLYPEGKWTTDLRPGDEDKLIQLIENSLKA
jgi:predicted metal-binding protein